MPRLVPPPLRPARRDDEHRARLRLASLLPWAEPHADTDVTAGQAGTDVEEPAGAPVRLRIDRRGAAVLAVIALAGVLLGAWLLWRARPVAAELGPARLVTDAGRPTAGATPAPGPSAVPELVVDVQGAVRRPGVVRLPAGSRVLDALASAGGPRAGVSTIGVNLARLLADGEQVVLLPPGAPGAPTAAAGPAAGPVAGPAVPLDLNAATLAELEALPGVGPVLAGRIVDFRTVHGRFTAVEELQEVPGIGEAKYADLRARVRV